MSAIHTILWSAIILVAMMSIAWAVQKRTHQSGWADVFWSFAIGFGGVLAALLPMSSAPLARQMLVTVMVTFWSIRLGHHIMTRTFAAKYEDSRYADLRKTWGEHFQLRLFLFLQIQALCGVGLVVTVFAAAQRPGASPSAADIAGLIILIISVIGEAIADRQLRAFTADKANHGKVCEVGLWSWSRHPNYFFEWLGWIAYPIIAIDPSGAWWQGWLALIGPALMYWLLVFASGIPPLEAHMLRSRGDAFRAYMARTSAFFPLPPRKNTWI
jgi:steroid 5-alpha reductase family enzyme